jgi:bacterioferritin (cytochrome b1)
LIEGILADEEQHLTFLRTEVDLYERLGEALYTANRLGTPAASSPP